MAGNIKKDKRYFSLGVFLIGILTLSFMGVLLYMGYSSQTLANKQTPQVRALKQIKIEIITAHLWLEEILSGDRSENIQTVLNHFEESDDYFHPLLNGGRFGNMQILRVEDPVARSLIGEMLLLKDTLLELSALRYTQLEKAQAGTSVDREFDAVFGRFLQKSYDAEKALVELQQKNIKTYNSTQLLLVISVFALGVLILVLFVWLEQFKNKKQKELKLVNTKLLGSEKRFRLLYENAPLSYQSLDANGCFIDVNQTWQETLAYSRDEVIGKHFSEFMTHESAELVKSRFPHFLAEGKINKAEFEMVRKDGSHLFVSYDGKIGTDEFGNFKQTHCIFSDITKQKQAENELNIANRIINRSPAVAFLWKNEKGWPIEFVSENIERLTGYSVDEFMSKRKVYNDLIYEQDIKRVGEEVAHYSAEKDTISFEHKPYRIISKSGEMKWVDDSTIIRRDANGVITHYEGVLFDITGKKRAEEDLILEKEFSEKIIETSSAIIVGLDKNHLIQLFNKGAEEITGYSKAEVEGKDWFKIFFPSDVFDEMNKVWGNAWGAEAHSYENPIIVRSGEKITISWQTTGIYDGEDSSKNLMISIGENITERKKAEDALHESQAFNQTLVDTSPDLIYVYDIIDRKNIYSNQGIQKILGYSIKEIQTMGENLLPELIHPDDFNNYLKEIIPRYQTIKDGEILEHEYRMKHKNGNWCWLNSKESVFMRLDNGTPKQIFGLTSDITNRKISEKELEKYRDHLEEIVKERTDSLAESQNALLNLVDDLNRQSAKLEKSNVRFAAINQELETFTYSVSHDLKAPLRGIDGYSQLLLDIYYEELNPEARGFLENIRKSTQQMNLLIEDLLAYSRMERQGFQSEKVQFKSLIDNLLLYFSKSIETKNVQVKLDFPKSFSPIADKDGLNLVVRNLLDNAIKFSRSNIKAKIEIGGSENDTQWLIFVKDNGIGFDMKYHDRIFKIFQRLHLAEEYEGTGIGLAMVGKAIQRMNGKIWAESKPGKGTCFYIKIRK